VPHEIPLDEKNHITAENTAETIEKVVRESGRTPSLLFVEHADYQYGNIHDVCGIAKVAHQYDIPVLLNGAYTVGIMPVDGKALGVDFVVGSGHKSMAAPAPSGVLATTDEYADKVFRTTQAEGDVTKRRFGIKEVEMMGCTLMGVTLVGLMASFPAVKERVKNWDTELKHSNIREHTLTRVNTIESFNKVAETHKKRGYFLSKDLKKRGVVGVIPGSTMVWKYNTFGLTDKQTEHVADSFRGIAEDNGLTVC